MSRLETVDENVDTEGRNRPADQCTEKAEIRRRQSDSRIPCSPFAGDTTPADRQRLPGRNLGGRPALFVATAPSQAAIRSGPVGRAQVAGPSARLRISSSILAVTRLPAGTSWVTRAWAPMKTSSPIGHRTDDARLGADRDAVAELRHVADARQGRSAERDAVHQQAVGADLDRVADRRCRCRGRCAGRGRSSPPGRCRRRSGSGSSARSPDRRRERRGP